VNSEPRKQALRFFYSRVVEPMGFTFTPDAALADFILEQEVALEAQPNPRPMFPNPPGLLRLEPYSGGLSGGSGGDRAPI